MPTNFLYTIPGSSAGYIPASGPITIISSELTSLVSSGTTTSAATYTSTGTFSQAIWADVFIKWGGGITPTTGGYISGWFVRSPDGGGSFELTGSAIPMARAPDFTIPLSTQAYANTNVAFASGIVRMPFSPCKIFIQNNTGATFPSSATAYTVIGLGPDAVQY
jgi:hypothetical protein